MINNVIVADAKGRTDGPAYNFLQRVDSKYPIVLVSRVHEFEFNEQLLDLKGKPYILCDFTEMGWQWDQKEGLIWGFTDHEFDFLSSNIGYNKFSGFVGQHPPVISFYRELLKRHVREDRFPIEYPNWQQAYPVEPKEQFDRRPLLFMNFWGRSHEARVQLHGEIWKHASKMDYSVCDNIFFFNDFMREERGKKAVSMWMPHYGRTDISNILAINALSKLSFSLPGNGVKCFRSTGESLVNSIPVVKEDSLAWTFPFSHFDNAIKFWNFGEEMLAIEEALQDEDLYEVYLESLATANKYRIDNYTKHIESIINEL